MSAERSTALVRRWVALYTLGLPAEIKQDRRDEIDDDLWCQAQAASESSRAERSLAGAVVARLLFGIPSDVSWRIEQRRFGKPRPRHERSLQMHARLPAVLALVGGAAWSIWPVHAGLISGPEEPGGLGPTLTLLSVLGGTIVLALATLSLVAVAHDVFPSLLATLAVIGAFISTLAVVGPWQAALVLPLSSLLVVWQLSRVGALPRWIFWMHGAAPITGLAIIALGLAGIDVGQMGLLLVVPVIGLLYLYPLSWLAIGWSLLRTRSVAPAPEPAAGASAA